MKFLPKLLPLLVVLNIWSCQAPGSSYADEGRVKLHGEPMRYYDAMHYDITVQVNEKSEKLLGQMRMDFEITRHVDRLVLDAAGLEILGVKSSAEISGWDLENNELEIYFDQPQPNGFLGWVAVKYRANPGKGIYFQLNQRDVPPHIFTQGECNDTRYWLPCNDSPNDRATYSLTAVVPRNWTTVSGGSSIGEKLISADTKIVKWNMNQEIPPYLFSVVAGELTKLNAERRSRVLSAENIYYLVEPNDVDKARVAFEQTPQIVDFLCDYTQVDYPFAKYSQATVRGFPYGAMENASATTMKRELILSDQEVSPCWPTVAHELAHQWFGDIVTCKSWPHAWLNEGFATYFTQLYRLDQFGEDDFLYHYGQNLDGYLNACQGLNQRALVKYSYDQPLDLFFDGTIYPGGASRLHLLRGIVGEEVFKRGIKIFLDDNSFQSVESRDLLRAFQKAGARNMESFFREWVFSEGYPELSIDWRQERGQLIVDVEQVHPAKNPRLNASGYQSGRLWSYSFPLDIRYQLDSGQIHQQRVWADERQEQFRLEVSGKINWVSFDPEAWIPARLHVKEDPWQLLKRIVGSDKIRDRVLAVRQIANDIQDNSVLDDLYKIALDGSENQWLRLEILRAIQKVDRHWLFMRARQSPPSQQWLSSLPPVLEQEWRKAVVMD